MPGIAQRGMLVQVVLTWGLLVSCAELANNADRSRRSEKVGQNAEARTTSLERRTTVTLDPRMDAELLTCEQCDPDGGCIALYNGCIIPKLYSC